MRLVLFGIVALLALPLQGAVAQDTERYVPLSGPPCKIWPHERPGTLSGDFKRAKLSETPTVAQERWEAFLREHDPGEYEDGFHVRHVRAAKYELVRLYYLAGQVGPADRLLRDLMLSE